MKILVIAEHDNQTLREVNRHVLTAALQFEGEIHLFIAGFQCDAIIETAKTFSCINTLLVADHEAYQHQLPENLAPLLAETVKEYDVILVPASTFGKNLLPRVAALKNFGMVSDVVQILAADTFVRPVSAGNLMATVQTQDAQRFLSIRSTAFSAVQPGEKKDIPVQKIPTVIVNTQTRFISEELTKSERPELTSAKIIISGGRGLKSAENFKKLEALADRLGAAVGASRAAVDAGFAPNDCQVGQTGKVVAPELYIAVGISGAIQHLAGMKDSKVIVAINSDPEAPIFQIADYGLVMDLFTALEQLETQLH